MSSARTFGDKYGKKVMDTATKTGIDAAKTASKRVVQKLQKLQETWFEINYFNRQTKRKGENKRNRRNLHFTRKETTNNWWP